MPRKQKIWGETDKTNTFKHLTNILKTNSAWCIIKVYTADFQRVQLCNVMPTDLHTGQNNLHKMYVKHLA